MNHLERGGHVALTALLIILPHPALAATIVVDDTTCTLVDAITAANTDSAVSGCAAGSGADTVELMTDVTLTEVNNSSAVWGPNGLPIVASDIAIVGGGFTIRRSATARFRLFRVGGTFSLDNVTLNSGDASPSGCDVQPSSCAGGAILILSGSLSLTNSTLRLNAAGNDGGGIAVFGGTASLTNSTLSGNSAKGGGPFGHGGGIAVFGGTASLTNSTLSGNSANSTGGGISGPATVANSIVANNLTGGNCSEDITDLGNNFADDDTCGPGFADITPDVDFDTELADNGGPTQTHALLAGSVAIDAAGDCGLATDQRGEPRDDGACDSGSYEYQEPNDVPASSFVGLAILFAVLVTISWLILRPRPSTPRPT